MTIVKGFGTPALDALLTSKGTILLDATKVKTSPRGRSSRREQTTSKGQRELDAHRPCALAGSDRPAANGDTSPTQHPLPGTNLPADHAATEAQTAYVGGNQTEDGSPAIMVTVPIRRPLADPFLALTADVREDLQEARKANANRLRHLQRHAFEGAGDLCERCSKTVKQGTHHNDKDGVLRGLGLDERHPAVARLAALVDMLAQAEHQASLNLAWQMRQHPLAPWLKSQKGVGHGVFPARLLAIIGDPYLNPQTGQPRTVSQLWAYCGHGDPTRRKRKGMTQADLFALGNPAAKSVVWNISCSCLKAGGDYADVYRARRAATAERVHAAECVRCGPSGKPALPGSPWSAAHQHADALRIVGKTFLRDLWREAKRLHETDLAKGDVA